jgi:hypothetical protein
MKLSTIRTAYDLLTGTATHTEEERLEVIQVFEDELTKNATAKAAKEDEYATAWDAVKEVLSGTTAPLTVADIYAKAEEKLPEGFGKGKVQYGMTHTWADKVVKIEGKPNTYRLK